MIMFSKNQEKLDYEKYRAVRGNGAYQLIEDVLIILSQNNMIPYETFSGLMRYDKRLRDLLYTYLGTFEEYLRNLVFNSVEYKGNKIITKINKKNFDSFDAGNTYDMNFYKHACFDFGSLITIVEMFYAHLGFDPMDTVYKVQLKNIQKLRNLVMHHSFILINPLSCDSIEKIEQHKDKIKVWIDALHDSLPSEWQLGFKKEFNDLNIKCLKSTLSDYALEEMK